MARGEHFEVGHPITVKVSSGEVLEGVVVEIRTGKKAYPFDDRTILDTAFRSPVDDSWHVCWYSAEDPDVHPHPDPDWGTTAFVKHVLLHGVPPYDA